MYSAKNVTASSALCDFSDIYPPARHGGPSSTSADEVSDCPCVEMELDTPAPGRPSSTSASGVSDCSCVEMELDTPSHGGPSSISADEVSDCPCVEMELDTPMRTELPGTQRRGRRPSRRSPERLRLAAAAAACSAAMASPAAFSSALR